MKDSKELPTNADVAPCPSRCSTFAFTNKHVEYVQRYGGMCRDCADESGVCPSSGLPCGESSKAIRHVFAAIEYGVNHQFIENPNTWNNSFNKIIPHNHDLYQTATQQPTTTSESMKTELLEKQDAEIARSRDEALHEYDRLEDAFRALYEFCECELRWMYFRNEFLEGDANTATSRNAAKLATYLDGLKDVPVVKRLRERE